MQEEGNFRITRIEQPDTWSCFACCAAMCAGETLQDVVEFLGHDGSHTREDSTHPEKRAGFAYSEILRYLIDRGWSLGCYVSIDGKKFKDMDLDEEGRIKLLVPLSPGMFVVSSRRFEGERHIVVWDGKHIHDPSSLMPGLRSVEEYELHEFWPLCDFRDSVWKETR